ncbi:MAG: M28 family peptidase [Pseudomonadales bacterium]
MALLLGAVLPSANAAVTAAEQELLDRIDAAAVLADMRRLAKSADGVDQGVGNGSVVAGSPEERALAEHIASRFDSLGLEVTVETFPVREYRYAPPRLEANGEPIAAISLHAAGAVSGRRDGVAFALGNEANGTRLRAPLVDAGEGFAADYARVGDVRGKAVLVQRDLRDWPPAQITEAANQGAVAVVFHDHPSSADRVDALRQDSMWAHEQIPAVAISIASARALQAQLAAGPVMIALESSVEIGDGHSQNVLGTIRGSELPDQWVVVSGHYDRWFEGGVDNVSGTAAVLEMARVFAESGVRPRRSMLFLAVGSEEAGLADFERDWLAGSHAFLLAHPEVFRHAALVANVDGIGWPAQNAWLGASPDVLAAHGRMLEDLGLAEDIGLQPGTSSAIDAWNYAVLGGAATTHLFSLDPAYFAIYHTQEDVVVPEHFTELERNLRLLALGLLRAATSPRWTPALGALADSVRAGFAADVERLPGLDMHGLDAALDEFRAAALAVEAGAVPGLEGASADRLLMATRHMLVPWLYVADADYTQAVRTADLAARVVALTGALEALDGGDRAAALEALAVLPEGRRCVQLSAESYALERHYWAGEGGWASRFGHRAPPPLPAFEAACRALLSADAPDEAIEAGLDAARTDALFAASGALALVSAKLRAAAGQLRQAGRTSR